MAGFNHIVYYVMGVSGSGKSTIGKMLSNKLNCLFFDGDDFHSEKNILKMKSGHPLTTEDRSEWLSVLHKLAKEKLQKSSLVISCSALKEQYRQILQKDIDHHCTWIYLQGDIETIAKRMNNRVMHFMPSDLLQSQFDTLEEPAYGIHINVKQLPEEIIQTILQKLNV